jgi:sugar lactone lactonase YvrE
MLLVAMLIGCGSSSHATAPDAGKAPTVDAANAPTVLAQFDKSQNQLPEGLWQLAGTPVVTWAPLASVQGVTGGAAHAMASLGAASNTFSLGIVGDAAGRLYVGVGASATIGAAPGSAQPVTPAPGIYMVPPGGGSATRFSDGSMASPAMTFPNGLALHGADLFVADSAGTIYELDAAGHATAWSQDPLLAPSQPACGGVVPLSVGANGLVATSDALYVTNTNYGRLLKFAIGADGQAGAAQVVAEDCALLAGADGLVQASDGSFYVAVNAQNRIVRVAPDGELTTIAEGAPLDTPASVVLDESTTPARLLVTSSAFFSGADGTPGLVAVPLPK